MKKNLKLKYFIKHYIKIADHGEEIVIFVDEIDYNGNNVFIGYDGLGDTMSVYSYDLSNVDFVEDLGSIEEILNNPKYAKIIDKIIKYGFKFKNSITYIDLLDRIESSGTTLFVRAVLEKEINSVLKKYETHFFRKDNLKTNLLKFFKNFTFSGEKNG